jgi:hypothetical protein
LIVLFLILQIRLIVVADRRSAVDLRIPLRPCRRQSTSLPVNMADQVNEITDAASKLELDAARKAAKEAKKAAKAAKAAGKAAAGKEGASKVTKLGLHAKKNEDFGTYS